MTTQNYTSIAQDLHQKGHAYAPINNEIVTHAHESQKAFITLRQEKNDFKKWRLTRKGENEIDRGIQKFSGGRKDIKFVSHFDPCLKEDLKKQGDPLTKVDDDYFASAQILYDMLTTQVASVLIAYDKLYKTNMLSAYLHTIDYASLPYATTVLRGLGYPPVVNQSGAKGHIDRSLITTCLPGEGGSLLGALPEHPGEMVEISPKPGYMLLFWGVKVLWVTKGQVKPLWHSSETTPGEPRWTMAMFHHIFIDGYEVRDAKEAKRHYWDNVHEVFP